MVLRYFAAPFIGAVIGYFTNFIAVKMLFYPRNEARLFGHKLPFTPGAIPKGKARLAKAIGTAVGEQLLTGEDLKERLKAPEFVGTMSRKVLDSMDRSLTELAEEVTGNAALAGLQETISTKITEEIYTSVQKLPIADIIVEKGAAAIKEKTAGTMLQMFMSPELINSVAGPVGVEIEEYIRENGKPYIRKEVEAKCAAISEMSVKDLLMQAEPEEEKQTAVIGAIYSSLVDKGLDTLMQEISISGMVEEKINAMEITKLEELVLSVMKKELNTIVNLGALIGFVLGLINLLF